MLLSLQRLPGGGECAAQDFNNATGTCLVQCSHGQLGSIHPAAGPPLPPQPSVSPLLLIVTLHALPCNLSVLQQHRNHSAQCKHGFFAPSQVSLT